MPFVPVAISSCKMAPIPDPYRTLGVGRHARLEDIRAAYHAQMKLHHPDRNLGDQEGAERASVAIGDAFRILGNPEARAAYDAGVVARAQRSADKLISDRPGRPAARPPVATRRSKRAAGRRRRVGLIVLGVAALAGVGGLLVWANGGWSVAATPTAVAGDPLAPFLIAPRSPAPASAVPRKVVGPTSEVAVAQGSASSAEAACESIADVATTAERDQAIQKLFLDRLAPATPIAGATDRSTADNCLARASGASSALELAQP